jgi:hypothetical protein
MHHLKLAQIRRAANHSTSSAAANTTVASVATSSAKSVSSLSDDSITKLKQILSRVCHRAFVGVASLTLWIAMKWALLSIGHLLSRR